MQRNLSGLIAAAIIGSAFAPINAVHAAQVNPPQTQTQTQADTPAKPHTESSGPTLEMTRLLLQMSKYAKAGDKAEVVATLKEITTHPDFAGLFVDIRRDLYIQLAYYQFEQEAYTDAEASLDKAGALKGTPMTAGYWLMRSDLAITQGKKGEAVEAFTRLVQQFPDKVNEQSPRYVFSRVRTARLLEDQAPYRKLLEALWSAEYTPDGGYTADDLWFELFEIYISESQTTKATALAKTFKTSASLTKLTIDARYWPLREVTEKEIDAALEYDLDIARAAIAASPEQFSGTLRLTDSLLAHNRTAAALAILDTELARIDTAPKDNPPFTDLEQFHSWGLDTRSRLLRQLGRYDEAEKAMIRAHEISRQNQSDMVSHKINLGGFHNSLARPKDALKAVSHIADKDASTYGQMSAEEVRACAYAQMGDSAKLKASLDKMMAPENAKIGYRPLETALLCAKESDRLAQFIIARLDDPKTRNSALMGLQTYLPTPGATAQDKVLATRQAAVIARDDIQAAVKKYGRIISIPTQPPNY